MNNMDHAWLIIIKKKINGKIELEKKSGIYNQRMPVQ
jgi:hypothetical protein